MIQEAIRRVTAGEDLTENAAQQIVTAMMEGEATGPQIAALLVGLRMKGETTDEILGIVRAMRRRMTPVRVSADGLVDTCGTGGDAHVFNEGRTGTFNISTVAAFVAAGAGCRVAKHGNRAMSSRCGSADLLSALGVSIETSPAAAARCIDEIGIGFLYAPLYHPSLRHAATARREIGIRTVLNLAGPLVNPAGARRQLLGVFDARLTEPLARVLSELGSTHCMVVHGSDGLDEISITGPTRVTELREGRIHTYSIASNEFGLSTSKLADLQGGDETVNAKIAMQVLNGDPGPTRDVVLLNAGAAAYVAGRCDSLRQGLTLAADSIDSGRALGKLEALRDCLSGMSE